MHATPLRGLHARTGPRADNFPLEFRECAHHLEHQTPAGHRRVDIVVDAQESGAGLAEIVDNLDQVAQGAAYAAGPKRKQKPARRSRRGRFGRLQPPFSRAGSLPDGRNAPQDAVLEAPHRGARRARFRLQPDAPTM